MFGRKTVAINVDPKYTLKVGHDRYNNLIIKELRVSGDNLDDIISQVQEALSRFNEIKGEAVLN
jgi:hypothetical protein